VQHVAINTTSNDVTLISTVSKTQTLGVRQFREIISVWSKERKREGGRGQEKKGRKGWEPSTFALPPRQNPRSATISHFSSFLLLLNTSTSSMLEVFYDGMLSKFPLYYYYYYYY